MTGEMRDRAMTEGAGHMTGWRDDERSVVFAEPLDIAGERAGYVAHAVPGAAAGPARRRLSAPGHCTDLLIHADHSVTACACHVPVVEDGLILGLRARPR